MKKEDLELAKQEFMRDRDLWTDLVLKRRFYYAELLTRVTDRQINHILTLTTLAVAIIAIVFARAEYFSLLTILSFVFLSFSVLLGTGLVLNSIFRDKNGIPKLREKEVSIYSRFQSAANQNYSKAYSGTLVWQDVEDYFGLRNQIQKELENIKDNKAPERIINIVYIAFLFSFFGGFILFIVSTFCKNL